MRRGEGLIAADGPARLPHRASTPAARPTTSSSSASRRARREIAWGAVNRPMDPAQFDALHRDLLALARRASELFVQDCFAGADPAVPPADPRHHRVRLAQPVRAQPVHRRSGRRPRRRRRRSSRSSTRRASRPIRPATARAPRWSSRSTSPKRLVLIGGTSYAGEIKKSIFSVLNYLLPLAGRAADALLGQRRAAGRRGAVLRPVGHGQDDALERSRAPADRRRRARLERSRRLQLRRRLLRQDDPAVGRGRAADLRHHAPLRHRARERRRRPGRRGGSTSTTTGSPRTRARPIRSRSSTTRCRPGRAAIRRTSSC